MTKPKFYILIIFSFLFTLISLCPSLNRTAFAIDGQINEYIIYDEENKLISKKSDVEVGDIFITSDYIEYEIYKVEDERAFAHKIRKIIPPTITRKQSPQRRGISQKKICLYMTHNDESYTPSDGYDSIYGEGGIHDVAKKFAEEFADRNINVTLDETLHIPHDSNAYNRSNVTAKRLYNQEYPDAQFDIHRDGIAKKYYYTNQDGNDFSKVRIVVGKSNPNFEENYAFAQKVFALGNSMYPWLFLDIYCGKGHYNQSFQSTNLLFEMGTYLIEKEYVYNSIPYLVDVIETALYSSESNGDDEIIVDESSPDTNEIITGNNGDENQTSGDYIEESSQNKKNSWVGAMVVSLLLASGLIIGSTILYNKSKEKKKKD